jgi:hypothetical protein
VGAYALPTAVGFASQLGHDLEHLVEEVRGLEADGPPAVDDAGPAGFVHAHGAGAHGHSEGLGKLLVAAQQTEEHHDDAAVTPLELTGHLPAVRGSALVVVADASLVTRAPMAAATGPSLPPPLPPPRG